MSHLPGCYCKIRCMSEVIHEPLEEVARRYKDAKINNKLDDDPRYKDTLLKLYLNNFLTRTV